MLKDYKAFYSPKGGQVEYIAPLEKPLAAGEPLLKIWRFDQLATENTLSETLSLPCDAIPVLHFASASVQKGTELYKVLTNTFKL